MEVKTLKGNYGEGMKATGKIVKRVLFMMAVMLIIISLAGCGDKKEETKATVVQEPTSASENEGNGFDFSQVFDHIEINGKSVSFPFAVSELGDKYSVDYIIERGDGTCGASLLYEGIIIATLDYIGDKKEDINEDTKCFGINIGSMGKEIYINGINCEGNLEDVRQHFSNLWENVNEEGRIISSEAKEGEKYIGITYREDLSISFIFINRNTK